MKDELRIADPELDAHYHGPLPKAFKIGAAHYTVDPFGIIHQQPPYTMPKYDVSYVVERYDMIPEQVEKMSFLRAGFLRGVCGPIGRLLDVGYGNGQFLRTMQLAGCRGFGTDISGYPVPPGCEFIPWAPALAAPWGLVTFFDSLEHFPTLDFLGRLNATWIAVTAPCVSETATVDWLAGWKHLRPGEHLHHFKPSALTVLLQSLGYRVVIASFIEDMLRPPPYAGAEPNTFTAVYRR